MVTDRPSCTNVQPGTGRLGWLSPMRTSGAGCPGVSFTRRAGHRRAACARRSSACVAPRSTPVSSLGLSRPSGAVRPPGGSGNDRCDALRSGTLGRAAGVGLGSGPCVVDDKVPVGSRTGGSRIAAVRAAERLTRGCPSPAPTGRVRRSSRHVDSQARGVRGRFDLVARYDPPVVLHPGRYATGKAVSRDRAHPSKPSHDLPSFEPACGRNLRGLKRSEAVSVARSRETALPVAYRPGWSTTGGS